MKFTFTLTQILAIAFMATWLPAQSNTATKLEAIDTDGREKPSDKKATPIGFHSFVLQVNDVDGKPIPKACVKISTHNFKASQIVEGKFVQKTEYDTLVESNESGTLSLLIETNSLHCNFSIVTTGYAPYSASFPIDEKGKAIPKSFTAELEPAWSVGGIVVDQQGNAIQRAKISPRILIRKAANAPEDTYAGSIIETDAEGKWQYGHVPISQADVFVEINHPNFMPLRRTLARDSFECKNDANEALRRIEIQHGLSVVGAISDENGKPVEGAVVKAKFLNDIRETKSDADGRYRLEGCEPLLTRIVVHAPGRALDMKVVRIVPEMEPVDFEMQPGGQIRIRVVDENGKGIPNSRLFFQSWRGQVQNFEFRHAEQTIKSDAEGFWEWNEAPHDPLEVDIIPATARMTLSHQEIIAGTDAVFAPPKLLVVSGLVVDSETKKPISKFRVVPGIIGSKSHIDWISKKALNASGGKYRLNHENYSYRAHLIRIEAEGYLPVVSREISSDEGNVKLNFELERGQDISAIVLTPNGMPASKAELFLCGNDGGLTLKNGRFSNLRNGLTSETDAEGKFRFPPQTVTFQLVIIHPSGYAHLLGKPSQKIESIQLQTWAKVEGVFRVGKSGPVADAPIMFDVCSRAIELGLAYGFCAFYNTTTARDGSFVFDRVLPGEFSIRREIIKTINDGAAEKTSTLRLHKSIAPGETLHIDLGGQGRPIIGNLKAKPGLKEPVQWNFGELMLESYFPPLTPPVAPVEFMDKPEKLDAWMKAWRQSPLGLIHQANVKQIDRVRATSPRFNATIDRDATFRIDDVPAGRYSIKFSFDLAHDHRESPGEIDLFQIEIPKMEESYNAEPIDLGDVQLR